MAVTDTFMVYHVLKLGNVDGADNFPNYTIENDTDNCFDEEEDLQIFHSIFQPALYALIFLLGVVGNSLTVTVLLRRRRLLRITEIYLLHLALADMMLLLTLPFDIVEIAAGWVFGKFLCKLTGLMKNLNLICGSFLLACIGFDRYLAIVHAIPSRQSRRPRTVSLTCIVLWLICFGLAVPNVVFLGVTEEEPLRTSRLSCLYYQFDVHSHNWVLTKSVLQHVCFFLPLAIMSYCYTALAVFLYNSQKSQAKQGAIRLSLLVTLVFCFCWLPYNVTLLIKTLTDLRIISQRSCWSFSLMYTVLDVTQSLGFSHCCLNPFLYAFVGVRFRNELIQLLCRLCCSRVCGQFTRTQGHNRASISEGTTTSTIL
ncbi:C-X-C chemokine receptor type 3 [Aulostomus maculatus]